MPSLDFFAARTDMSALLSFLFDSTDVRVFESYSEYEQPLKEFCSFEALAASHEVGVDEHGKGRAILLQLWSPSVMSRLDIQQITLDPSRCNGHTLRYNIDGWGLIQLYLGGVHNHVITKSHYGHNSEKRAQAWGHAEDVNWEALAKLSSRIRYHISRRLAVAKVPGRPVLSEAYELARSGYELKEHAKSSERYELPPPSPVGRRGSASG